MIHTLRQHFWFICTVLCIAFFAITLPSLYGTSVDNAHALSLSSSLNIVPATINGAVHTAVVDGVFYVVFSSSTPDTGYDYLFLTTSTDAVEWSEPVVVSEELRDGGNVYAITDFHFTYSAYNGFFAMTYRATSSIPVFSTSSDGVTWTTSSLESVFTSCDQRDEIGMAFATNSPFAALGCNVYGSAIEAVTSSNAGSSWSGTSTIDSLNSSSAAELEMRISGSSGSETLHVLYTIVSEGVNYIRYASSTDLGSTFSTTTLHRNPLNIDGGTARVFEIDGNGNPGLLYLAGDSAINGSTYSSTTSLIYAFQNSGGVWASTTVSTQTFEIDISGGLRSASEIFDLIYFNTDDPIIFFAEKPDDHDHAIYINTSSFQTYFFDDPYTQDSTFFSKQLAYNTTTAVLAAFSTQDGILTVVTSSLQDPSLVPDAAPSGGAVSGITTTGLNVSWADNASNETGYYVRLHNGETITDSVVSTSASLAAGSTSTDFTGLSADTEYLAQIFASNIHGVSTSTASSSVYTLAVAPTSVTAAAAGQTSATVTWSAAANNADTKYAIYETNTGLYVDENRILVSEGSEWGTTSEYGGLPVTITGLTAGTEYCFGVAARNGDDVETTTTTASCITTTAASSGGGSSSGGGGHSISKPTIKAGVLLINNGDATTGNQNVTLTLPSTDATLMAVSEDEDFIGASFVSFAKQTTFVLSAGNGVKTVYVKLKKSDGGTVTISDTIELTGQGFNQPEDEETPPTNCPLPTKSAYKASGSPSVYYITSSCTKRAFVNPQKFATYFPVGNPVPPNSALPTVPSPDWSKVGTSNTINSIPNDTLGFMPWGPYYNPQFGALVKQPMDPKVYLLLNGKKNWITDATVFEALNYQWSWIEDVDADLLPHFTTGEEIDYTDHHPDYSVIKYSTSAKVYQLQDQKKRWVPTPEAFNTLHFRWDRIITVPSTESYEDGTNF